MSSDLLSLASVQGDKRPLKLWPSQRALRGPWREEPSVSFAPTSHRVRLLWWWLLWFQVPGRGREVILRDWRRVSEHANEPFSTSHFQILKLLKGEGENSGLKRFHGRFKPYRENTAATSPPLHSFALASGRTDHSR